MIPRARGFGRSIGDEMRVFNGEHPPIVLSTVRYLSLPSWWDRQFESASLQGRVSCEPVCGIEALA
jgi:hypothetical protein